MVHIQTHALTYVFCTTCPKCSIECKIDHTPKARQVKMTSDVSHLYQFIPAQMEIVSKIIFCFRLKIHLWWKYSQFLFMRQISTTSEKCQVNFDAYTT